LVSQFTLHLVFQHLWQLPNSQTLFLWYIVRKFCCNTSVQLLCLEENGATEIRKTNNFRFDIGRGRK
jgi:hypothetical protein